MDRLCTKCSLIQDHLLWSALSIVNNDSAFSPAEKRSVDSAMIYDVRKVSNNNCYLTLQCQFTLFSALLVRDKSQVHRVCLNGDFQHLEYLSHACKFLCRSDCCAFWVQSRCPCFGVEDVGRVAAGDLRLLRQNRWQNLQEKMPCYIEPSRRRPTFFVLVRPKAEIHKAADSNQYPLSSNHQNRHLKFHREFCFRQFYGSSEIFD